MADGERSQELLLNDDKADGVMAAAAPGQGASLSRGRLIFMAVSIASCEDANDVREINCNDSLC